MKVCITAQGNNLDSQVDPRFGRCQYFIFIDTETLEFEAVDNVNMNGSGGAGIHSGQLVAEKGVKIVITGNVGPNAHQTLRAANIDIYIGASGTIKQALEKYKNGGLKKALEASVTTKSGMAR